MLNIFSNKINAGHLAKVAEDNILSLKAQEGWLHASLWRYESFFGRDSAIVSLELLKIYPSIAKSSLLHLSKTQGKVFNKYSEEEEGKILLEEIGENQVYLDLIKTGFTFPSYSSWDATPLYILLAEKYLEETKDNKTIASISLNIEKALKWIYTHQDELLFCSEKPFHSNTPINQNWIDSPKSLSYKDGTLPNFDSSNYPIAYLEIQAMIYAVIRDINPLTKYFSQEGLKLANYFKSKNDILGENINKYFFMEDEKYFAPAIDAKRRKFDIITSVPASYLLYTKTVTREQADMIKERVFKGDMLTPFGVRILSSKEKQFDPHSYQQGAIWPNDNWMIYEGLKNYGYIQEAEIIKESVLKALSRIKYIPELYNVEINGKLRKNKEAMKVQAWACGGVLAMIKNI